jgi:chromate reductase
MSIVSFVVAPVQPTWLNLASALPKHTRLLSPPGSARQGSPRSNVLSETAVRLTGSRAGYDRTMASQTSTVLGIVGSLREGSFNARLLARAAALAPGGVRVETFGKLGEIPHFSQDLEAETPPAVTELRAAIESAGALLIATPEYNSAMPGVLKNALDWASRPPGRSALADKAAAAIGASPGRFGAQRAQADVRKVLSAIGADVLDRGFQLPRAHQAFGADGELLDDKLDSKLCAFVTELVDHAGGLPAEESLEAFYSRECQQIAS